MNYPIWINISLNRDFNHNINFRVKNLPDLSGSMGCSEPVQLSLRQIVLEQFDEAKRGTSSGSQNHPTCENCWPVNTNKNRFKTVSGKLNSLARLI